MQQLDDDLCEEVRQMLRDEFCFCSGTAITFIMKRRHGECGNGGVQALRSRGTRGGYRRFVYLMTRSRAWRTRRHSNATSSGLLLYICARRSGCPLSHFRQDCEVTSCHSSKNTMLLNANHFACIVNQRFFFRNPFRGGGVDFLEESVKLVLREVEAACVKQQ